MLTLICVRIDLLLSCHFEYSKHPKLVRVCFFLDLITFLFNNISVCLSNPAAPRRISETVLPYGVWVLEGVVPTYAAPLDLRGCSGVCSSNLPEPMCGGILEYTSSRQDRTPPGYHRRNTVVHISGSVSLDGNRGNLWGYSERVWWGA